MKETLGDLRAKLQAQQQAQNASPQQYARNTSHARQGMRPLIEQVTNPWKNEKHDSDDVNEDDEQDLGCCDLEQDGSYPNSAREFLANRRFRRMLAVLLILACAAFFAWKKVRGQEVEMDESSFPDGFIHRANTTYGIARGGYEKDLVRIKSLDPDLLPGGPADPAGKRRLVFVGDVHGCKKELVHLLQKVEFNEEKDHLVLVGDTVTKGPDNLGVLDELIRLNATSVLGNHEDRLLHVAKKIHKHTPPVTEVTSSKGYSKDAALVRELKPHHLQYMRDMPLMLHIPRLPMAHKATEKVDSPITEHIIVVHAGLVPGVSLKKQDPYFVMNMRSINRRTLVPSAVRDGKNHRPWYDVWCWYNDRIFRKQSIKGLAAVDDFAEGDLKPPVGFFSGLWKNFFGKKKSHARPQVVIYGHDSKSGLMINRWSKGLDSGCVKGEKLTALVLNAKGQSELSHVKCKNYRD